MKQKIGLLFDALWLPVLLLVATSWLYAPWLNHDRLEQLQVISRYESTIAPYGWLFRIGDAIGALVIGLALWRSGMFRVQKYLVIAIATYAMLSIIDVVFAVTCYGQCSALANAIHAVHDTESVISFAVFSGAVAIDAFRNKQRWSQFYFAIQALMGALVLSKVISGQAMTFLQYVYQVSTIIWITFILDRYMPRVPIKLKPAHVRRIFAGLLIVIGMLQIIAAFHTRRHIDMPTWVAQHTVLTGALLLYLARQILSGQRRAAGLVAVVLATLVVIYSVITPHVVALALVEFTSIFLWLSWRCFDRNVGVPPIVSRLKNLWILVGGVAAALILLILVSSATGNQHLLARDARHVLSGSHVRVDKQEDRLERRFHRFRVISASLGIAVIVLAAWTLFQPATRLKEERTLSEAEAMELLKKYSTSSEDFFKLWPHDKAYYTTASIDGFIAYKQINGTVFCLADPICAPKDREALLKAFTAECRQHGWTASFFIISEASKQLYEHNDYRTFAIGSSAVVSIETFSETTIRDKWWRWQMNRAKKAGLTYEASQAPHAPELLREVREVSDTWLTRAGHREQGFALGYYNADYLQRCTLHLLRDADGHLIAFANQLPSYNNSTQATVDLIRFKPDFNGAMPVLIAHTITSLKDSAYKTFDLGYVPLAKLDSAVVQVAKKLAAGRFSSDGLEQFKGKFKPDWQPQYLAYDGDLIDLTIFLSRLEKALDV